MAGRHPADASRGPGFRVQVEHGLDARLARLHGAGAGPPQLPPRSADVLDDVRVLRELRAAHQPRRGRLRQGLAAPEDARRPLAAVGEPARLPGLHVGPPGQAAAVHGLGVRPGRGVGGEPLAGLVASGGPGAPRPPAAGDRPQQPLQGARRPLVAGRRSGRLPVDRRERRQRQRAVLPAVRQAGRGRRCGLRAGLRRELLGFPPPRIPDRPAPPGHVARGAELRLRRLRRLGRRQPRRCRGGRGAVARSAVLGDGGRTAAGHRLVPARGGSPPPARPTVRRAGGTRRRRRRGILCRPDRTPAPPTAGLPGQGDECR
jgi:hypothetical protein